MFRNENLQMGAYTRSDKKEINKDIEQVFEYFPILKERMNQPAGLLSGGEQQMLCISRALMSKPEIMLLDEPSLGLSPKLVKEIFEIIIRINKELKTTILLVEQNANIALSNSDFGYVLELGRIVMEGNSKELLKRRYKEFYLGQQDEGIRGERRWKKKKCGDKYNSKTFWDSVKSRGERVAMREKDLGIWQEIHGLTMEKRQN